MQSRNVWCFLFLAAWSGANPMTAANWWSTGTNQPPSLALVFGDGADSAWAVTGGKFTVGMDPALGRPVLTAAKDGLTLEGKTLYAGDQELVGSSRVDLQACKLEYSIVSPK